MNYFHPVEPLRPMARPFGMFSAITPTQPSQERWTGGVSWEPDRAESRLWAEGEDKDFSTPGDLITHEPIVIYGSASRTLAGDFGRASERATANLVATEEQSLGKAFFDEYLTPAAGTFGNAASVAEAVAALEQGMSETTAELPIFYMSPAVAVDAVDAGVVRRDGQRLTTAVGSPVVILWGVDTSAIFASGTVQITRSTIMEVSTSQPGTNDALALAERVYLVQVDPELIRSINIQE